MNNSLDMSCADNDVEGFSRPIAIPKAQLEPRQLLVAIQSDLHWTRLQISAPGLKRHEY